MKAIDRYECKPNDSPVPLAEFWQPGRIVSLCDMIEQIFLIDIAHSYKMLARILSLLEMRPESPSLLSMEDRKMFLDTLDILERGVSCITSKSIKTEIAVVRDAITNDGRAAFVLETAKGLHVMIRSKLTDAVCFLLPDKAVIYLSEDVIPVSIKMKIPECESDLRNANAALAFGFEQACIFHCMCALEPVLPVIAKRLKRLGASYDPKQTLVDTWGSIINKLDAEIKRLSQGTKSVKRNSELQQFSELCAHMRAVKGGWRDGTMHARGEFSLTTAKNILNQCTALIEYVAASSKIKGAS